MTVDATAEPDRVAFLVTRTRTTTSMSRSRRSLPTGTVSVSIPRFWNRTSREPDTFVSTISSHARGGGGAVDVAPPREELEAGRGPDLCEGRRPARRPVETRSRDESGVGTVREPEELEHPGVVGDRKDAVGPVVRQAGPGPPHPPPCVEVHVRVQVPERASRR